MRRLPVWRALLGLTPTALTLPRLSTLRRPLRRSLLRLRTPLARLTPLRRALPGCPGYCPGPGRRTARRPVRALLPVSTGRGHGCCP